jgi:nucleoside-diphosphate-sugar epimerase
MRVLVTGSNGFLGRHVVHALISEGREVRCMVQPGTNAACFANLNVEIVEADLVEPGSLTLAARGCQQVVHLAALVQDWGKRQWFSRINVDGTRNLLEASRQQGVERLLFVSSLAVHGFGDFIDATEETPLDDGGNPYAWSKIKCEELLNEAQVKGDLETVIVRPGWVPFGEWDILGFGGLASVLKKGIMPVVGNPDNLTCTAYAPNLAGGIVNALHSAPSAGQTYVLADSDATSWRDYFCAIGERLGRRPKLLRLPVLPLLGVARLCEMGWAPKGPSCRPPLTCYMLRLMTRNTHFSAQKARREIGFDPTVPLAEAVERTHLWWRAEYGA